MRILLVEPDHELGAVVCCFLAKEGHIIDYHNTAQEAIRAADTNQPEVVVLELAIPVHNGVAFLHEFRSYADWANIPVIVYSHIAPESSGLHKKNWNLHGIREYLYKPTTRLKQLQKSISDIADA